jgi:subtilisin family serine protease
VRRAQRLRYRVFYKEGDAIAVGRSSNRDLENDSAHGPKLEYLAPGVRVYSALPGNQYGLDTGTSFAAPCAAGVAALALAFRPAMTRIELRQLMIDACDKIGTLPYVNGRNDDYGYGRVSAKNAIALLQARVPERTPAALARGAERAVADRGDIYRYQLSAKSLDELRELLKGARLDLGCRAIARQDGDEFHVDAYATEEEVAGLQARTARRASSVRIERRQNITAEGRERMHEVSRSNRFSAARGLPQGLGVKE